MKIRYKNLNENEYLQALNFSYNEMVSNNQIEDNFKNKTLFVKLNLAKAYEDQLKFYGAYDKEQLVGVIGYESDYIPILFVNNKYRNKYIATKLKSYAINYYKNNNIKTIKLESTRYALEFYKKLGFEIDKEKNEDKYVPLKREI